MSQKKPKGKNATDETNEILVDDDDSVITRAFFGSAAVIVGLVAIVGGGYLIWTLTRPGEPDVEETEISSAISVRARNSFGGRARSAVAVNSI